MTQASRHRRIFYVVVPVASVILSVLAVELCLSLFLPQPHAIEANAYYVADERFGFRMMPNSVGSYFGRIPVVVNAHGHRDDWVPQRKPAGRRRILVLGDSFTVGAGVLQEEAYPQLLERLLRERDAELDVINAGVGGWEPFQYAEYLRTEGLGFGPDLVLVGFFVGNDTYNQLSYAQEVPFTAVNGRRVRRESVNDPLIAYRVVLYRHSHLARLILRRRSGGSLYKHPDYGRSICDGLSDWLVRTRRAYLKNHLREGPDTLPRMRNSLAQIQRIADTAAAAGVPLLVVLLPDMTQISPIVQRRLLGPAGSDRFDPEMPQRVLVRELQARRIPVLDLKPTFDGRECLYTNDTHFDAEGHRLVAQAIASYLAHARVPPVAPATEG